MKILVILPAFIPSTIIGVLRPLSKLESDGEIKQRIRVNKVSLLLLDDIKWCDVAIFCRNSELSDLRALYLLKSLGKKIIYEIDDNFEEISLSNKIGLYHRWFYRLHVLKRFYQISDITRVYSNKLFESAIFHGANAILSKSYFDKSIINNLMRPKSKGIIKIAYPTGRIDDPELEELVFEAIRNILVKHRGKVEFHLWRKTLPKQLLNVPNVILNKTVVGYENFIKSFHIAGFDIGIAPALNTPFFHSKTNNKYREFAGCGIAGVYSNFPPYSDTVENNKTGLLVSSSKDDWICAIDRLIVDEDLRNSIVENSSLDVALNYSFDAAVQSWRDCLASLVSVDRKSLNINARHNDFSYFGFISLDDAKDAQNKERKEYLMMALNALGLTNLSVFKSINDYIQSDIRLNMAACIFIINNESQLKKLLVSISYSTSAIIDLSKYHGDVHGAIKIIWQSVKLPCSFLVSEKQSKALNDCSYKNDLCCVNDVVDSTVIHSFSFLAGYPAAYIDLCERHLKYGEFVKIIWGSHRVTNLVSKFKGNFYKLKSSISLVALLIRCRLGRRNF